MLIRICYYKVRFRLTIVNFMQFYLKKKPIKVQKFRSLQSKVFPEDIFQLPLRAQCINFITQLAINSEIIKQTLQLILIILLLMNLIPFTQCELTFRTNNQLLLSTFERVADIFIVLMFYISWCSRFFIVYTLMYIYSDIL